MPFISAPPADDKDLPFGDAWLEEAGWMVERSPEPLTAEERDLLARWLAAVVPG